MRNEINDDNLYREGTIISAKVNPGLKLIVTKYRQRIYYCAVLGHPDQNNFAYFERELIPPSVLDQQTLFARVPELDDRNYVTNRDTQMTRIGRRADQSKAVAKNSKTSDSL